MDKDSPTEWTRLSPWLDTLLDLSPQVRDQRLAELRLEDAALADRLQQWLSQLEELDAAGFMASAAAPAPVLHAQAQSGQHIGAYTLDRLLGEGGMGAVWLAHRSDGRFEAEVAIKFLQGGSRSPSLARRFAREGQVLARLAHPHIARLLDAGLTPGDGQPYLVLEYVQGSPIDTWCDRQHLDLRQRLLLLLDVLDAAAHAHERLVLHRDLKPANILVNTQGVVKLLDFGIARMLGDTDAGDGDLTRVNGLAYTPRWASPEQIRGEPLTPASDVYALGLLAHELLTGLHPLGDETAPTRPQHRRRQGAVALPVGPAQDR